MQAREARALRIDVGRTQKNKFRRPLAALVAIVILASHFRVTVLI